VHGGLGLVVRYSNEMCDVKARHFYAQAEAMVRSMSS
jgi:hypothetical protein